MAFQCYYLVVSVLVSVSVSVLAKEASDFMRETELWVDEGASVRLPVIGSQKSEEVWFSK